MKISITALLTFFLLLPAAQAQTVADTLASNEDLSALNEALAATPVEDTLINAQDVTVFAPNNDAFERLPEGFAQYLAENQELFAEVINYHVVSEVLTTEDIARLDEIQTNGPAPLAVKAVDNQLFINNGTVTETIEAENGAIHVVDRVLLTPLLFDREPPADDTGEDTGEDTGDDSGEEEEDTDSEDTESEEE